MISWLVRLLKNPRQEAKICSWVSEMRCSVIMWETFALGATPVVFFPLKALLIFHRQQEGCISINRLHQDWRTQYSVLHSAPRTAAGTDQHSWNCSCRTDWAAEGAFLTSTKWTGLQFGKARHHTPPTTTPVVQQSSKRQQQSFILTDTKTWFYCAF